MDRYHHCSLAFLIFLMSCQFLLSQQAGQADSIQLFHPEMIFPDKEMRESMSTEEMNKAIKLALFTANGREDLDSIAPNLASDASYVIIKRLSFLEGVKAVQGLQSKIVEYKKLDKAYQELEAIEEQRRAVYDTIIQEEQNRTRLFIEANSKLNTQIDSLNVQYQEANDLAKKAVRGRTFKSWKIGIIGGVIGLTSGILFGIIGTN